MDPGKKANVIPNATPGINNNLASLAFLAFFAAIAFLSLRKSVPLRYETINSMRIGTKPPANPIATTEYRCDKFDASAIAQIRDNMLSAKIISTAASSFTNHDSFMSVYTF